MKIVVSLNARPYMRRSRYLATAARFVLYGLVELNVLYIKARRAQRNPVPPLYKSGVRYQNEPDNGEEEFADIPTVLQRGWGDCDDLAPWRVAELRAAGEVGASLRLTWKLLPNGRKLFHVLVRRADGSIEDPSAILGMGQPQ